LKTNETNFSFTIKIYALIYYHSPLDGKCFGLGSNSIYWQKTSNDQAIQSIDYCMSKLCCSITSISRNYTGGIINKKAYRQSMSAGFFVISIELLL